MLLSLKTVFFLKANQFRWQVMLEEKSDGKLPILILTNLFAND